MSKESKLARAKERAQAGAERRYPSRPHMTPSEAMRVMKKRQNFVAGALWWRATDGYQENEAVEPS